MDCVEYGVWNLLDGGVVFGGLIFIHFFPLFTFFYLG